MRTSILFFVAALAAAPAASADEAYDHAAQCAAVTAVMLSNLRAAPEPDTAKIELYDAANSAWIGKLAELAPDSDPGDRMGDVIAHQRPYNDDPDGAAKAAPVAEACVAEIKPS